MMIGINKKETKDLHEFAGAQLIGKDVPMSTRREVLALAIAATCQDRNTQYGEPAINLTCLAELKLIYRRYAGNKYSAQHEEAIESVFGKLARIACGKPGHKDNYIDGAAYLAIAYECENMYRVPANPAPAQR